MVRPHVDQRSLLQGKL
ncbi:hypothetical protein E2C01_097936 [Portunus trituberculatus]|uniref:Uncharacterized protein n=1 Tax=Portunus trituberculatus TaxID=210409 RepID=A0A5B7KAU9_PORTR|nr:hypothetical protein [Portunus trituberculatus]